MGLMGDKISQIDADKGTKKRIPTRHNLVRYKIN